MGTLPIPCNVATDDLWFSDNTREQRLAAKRCDEGCPLKQYTACREEGWNHEYGVWGGLTEAMRKRMDRKRYDAAVGAAEARSLEIDDEVVDVMARIERARLAAIPDTEVVFIFDVEDADIAELLAIEASSTPT